METLKRLNIFRRERKINEDYQNFKTRKIPMIWVMGPQDSENWTIASMLAECSKFQHIEVARLLRIYSTKRNDFPKSAVIKKCMEKEKPVPSDILIHVLKEEILLTFESVEGFIISGFPNDFSQVKLFIRKICGVNVIVHINLRLDAFLTRVLFNDSAVDINKARIRFIKYNKKIVPIRKKFEDKIIYVKCVYPKEDAVTKLLDILEDDFGYKFKRLYTK